MKELFKIPAYILLFPLLFYAVDIQEHVHTTNYIELVQSILIFYAVVLALYILAKKLLGRIDSNIYSICFFVAMFLYCFFSPIKSYIIKDLGLKTIGSYSILLPILVMLVLGIGFALEWVKRIHVTRYFNILSIVLLLVQIGFSVKNAWAHEWLPMEQEPFISNANESSENVYFILFDAYNGKKQMKDWYGQEQATLDSFFKSRGIYHRDIASNYNLTILSMNSMFNMDYVNRDYLQPWNDYSYTLKSYRYIAENEVFRFFKKSAYECHNLSLFNMKDEKQFYKLALQFSATQLMNRKMFHHKFLTDLSYHFVHGRFKTEYYHNKKYLYHYLKNEDVFQKTLELSKGKKKNQFVYAHMMLPHHPYLTDSMGRIKKFPDEFEGHTHLEGNYTNMVFARSYIKKYYNGIIDNDPDATVILCGDHGFRLNHDSLHPYVFNTMLSVYSPDQNYRSWDSVGSLVNVFPNLLNHKFQERIPFKVDSSFFVQESYNKIHYFSETTNFTELSPSSQP